MPSVTTKPSVTFSSSSSLMAAFPARPSIVFGFSTGALPEPSGLRKVR